MDVSKLEEMFSVTFQNKDILKQAFTHSSYVNEHQKEHLQDNERLEFLGDAVLELLVSDYLYHKYVQLPEGELTKLRARIVCEESLSKFALQLNLHEFILLGKGEEQSGGRTRQSLLADVFEAFLGAMYIDQGIQAVRQFLEKFIFLHLTDDVLLHVMDYKTALQEFIQEKLKTTLVYEIISEKGPSHAKQFEAQVVVDGTRKATGVGKTKKEAEQKAAKKMYEQLLQEFA